VLLFLLRDMAKRDRSFWGWTTEEWIDSIDAREQAGQHVVAVAYLLCGFSDLHRLNQDHIVYGCLARKVFGREYTKTIIDRVQSQLADWGYYCKGICQMITRTTFETLLFVRSPHLEAITPDHLRAVVARRPPGVGKSCIVALSRVLTRIGTIPQPLEIERHPAGRYNLPLLTRDVPTEWARLCRVWYERKGAGNLERRGEYYFYLSIGRWLRATHPEVQSPADWTRQIAAEAIAVICQWRCGDWLGDESKFVKNAGKILAPATRASRISSMRILFRDLQDWELIPRRLDPQLTFRTPKNLLRLIGPNPPPAPTNRITANATSAITMPSRR